MLVMADAEPTPPAETGGTELTRFNALRHGVLSRYTVLPWESADEYDALVRALVAEHEPQGPTEEHLVEELVGILRRKRRLRQAEAAAYRRGLEETLEPYRETVKAALVLLNAPHNCPARKVCASIIASRRSVFTLSPTLRGISAGATTSQRCPSLVS
jgi:hypothetical protein